MSGLEEGGRAFGITSHLILSFLRHLSEEDAFRTLEQAEPYLDRLLGVGLDSSEVGHPPSKFERVFAKAREKGLKSFAHAGEEGPPEYVHEALDLLKIDRLDHGNRALEDEALVKRLKEEKMVLTSCPLSNLKLCVIDDLKDSPLKTMLEAGLKATVNSDDPSYFGGYLNDNYIQAANALNLTKDDILTLVKNGIEGAYLSVDRKDQILAEFNAVVERHA